MANYLYFVVNILLNFKYQLQFTQSNILNFKQETSGHRNKLGPIYTNPILTPTSANMRKIFLVFAHPKVTPLSII